MSLASFAGDVENPVKGEEGSAVFVFSFGLQMSKHVVAAYSSRERTVR